MGLINKSLLADEWMKIWNLAEIINNNEIENSNYKTKILYLKSST